MSSSVINILEKTRERGRDGQVDEGKGCLLFWIRGLLTYFSKQHFIGIQPSSSIYVLFMTVFMLQWQSWIITTEVIWPVKLKIFTIWLLKLAITRRYHFTPTRMAIIKDTQWRVQMRMWANWNSHTLKRMQNAAATLKTVWQSLKGETQSNHVTQQLDSSVYT